jgi:hypothetical protein
VAAVVHVLLLCGGAGYGAYRYHIIERDRLPPVPNVEPLRIAPTYDRPDVVSNDQLQRMLEKLQPRLRGPNPKINYVDHALRFWGTAATFDDPQCLSGMEMRDLLLDHRAFSSAWGPKTKPFLVPDTRGEAEQLSFRTRSGAATASHVDHTLAALAEVGTPLDFPVITPRGETTLQAAFEQSLREFSLNQEEYEWSTLTFLHYLPHVRQWYTSEGQVLTWDRLAERLQRQRLAQGVCFGTHRLHALTALLRVDDEWRMLSPEGRAGVVAHLQDATARLVTSQHADGYWDPTWPGAEAEGPATPRDGLGAQPDRLLVTGHMLEWWALAPHEVEPPDDTLRRAAQWLVTEIDGLSASQVQSYYPFLTHAGRALSLWRGRFPHEALP